MPNNKLLKLFSIKIEHDFYASGKCYDFTVIASPSCKKLLQKYKMLFRELDDGIEVYYEADESNNPIIEMDTGTLFQFYLDLKKIKFYNISDIPDSDISSKIFYLTNKQASGTDSSILHTSSNNLGSDDFILLKPEVFTINKTSSSSKADFELKNTDGELIKQSDPIVELEDKTSPSDPDVYNILYYVNLENYSAGKYIIYFNGSELSKYYVDNSAYQKKYFGVIELFKTGYSEKEYKIKLTKKTCYWKYIIIPKYQTDITIEDLQIDSSELFEDVVKETLNDGSKAGVIESTNEISLTEQGLSSVKLQLKGTGNQVSTLIENLPNPDPVNIKTDKNTNQVYTEVFVYI